MNLISIHNDQTSEEKKRELAKRFGMEICEDVSCFSLVKERQALIPYNLAKQHKVLPLENSATTLKLGCSFPENLEIVEDLEKILEKSIEPIFVPSGILEKALEEIYQEQGSSEQFFDSLQESTSKKDEEGSYDLLDQHTKAPVEQMFNRVLLEALQQGASDIHFEPHLGSVIVRYRIDGVLQQKHASIKELSTELLTRIKVMAQLDIAEHRLPQDGRIKLRMGLREIDFRVSTVPVAYGERIVLRVLDKGNVVLGLDRIGMDNTTLQLFKQQLQNNQGIVLVTGPTGSGKTTTLYSAISEIASSELNIMTIEDPVEYKLTGMAQIGVNPKIHLTFATGLRHILRQDPDVIMIGEIRDKETAEIAIAASLTGHLVLSTLHTNDAPSALTRLVDMGIEPYLLTSSVIAILAQRLVRLCCTCCKTGYTPSDIELADLRLSREDLVDGVLYKGEGCSLCFGSGYKGRKGIYELMPVSQKIKKQLLTSPDSMELQKAALKEGMLSLREQGAELAKLGMTTVAEVIRVTKQIQIEE
jgi:general secretion pathway protein E